MGNILFINSWLDNPEMFYYGELFHADFMAKEKEVKDIRINFHLSFQNKPHFPNYDVPPCHLDNGH